MASGEPPNLFQQRVNYYHAEERSHYFTFAFLISSRYLPFVVSVSWLLPFLYFFFHPRELVRLIEVLFESISSLATGQYPGWNLGLNRVLYSILLPVMFPTNGPSRPPTRATQATPVSGCAKKGTRFSARAGCRPQQTTNLGPREGSENVTGGMRNNSRVDGER